MSHFYGSMRGLKGVATRCGTRGSGIHAHANGWNVGGYVECIVNKDGVDEVRFFTTTGSNGGAVYHFATLVQGEDVLIHLPNGKAVRICDE